MFDLLSCDVRLRAFRRASPSASDSDPASDIDNILKIYNDPSLAALVTQKFIVPRGAVLQDDFQRMIESDAEMFCIIESTPKCSIIPRFLGFTALWAHAERGHRHATFSLVLLPEAQNRGVGTILTRFMLERAFVHLNMHRVALSARGDNERALAVYRKCGFRDEGCQRKAYWIEGGWKDYVNMGILSDEWMDLQKVDLQ